MHFSLATGWNLLKMTSDISLPRRLLCIDLRESTRWASTTLLLLEPLVADDAGNSLSEVERRSIGEAFGLNSSRDLSMGGHSGRSSHQHGSERQKAMAAHVCAVIAVSTE
ncbi:MAG: hypothetical protein R3B91_13625 [Planctomycetaceae bacterium]